MSDVKWDEATFLAKLDAFRTRPDPGTAQALAATGDARALPALVKTSGDYMEGPDAPTYRMAVRTLATPEILTRWLADGDVEKRRVAAHALTGRDERHVPLIASALRDADDQVRAIARRSLGSWARSDALHALFRELLAHADGRVRALAAEGLGTLEDPADLSSLRAAMEKESDEPARHAMERALVKLGG